MEDHTTTTRTLRIYRDLHARYGNVGVVLQAYMRRTLRDIEDLPAAGRQRAPLQGDLRRAAQDRLEGLRDGARQLRPGAREAARRAASTSASPPTTSTWPRRRSALIDQHGLPPRPYEFQMLLGVDEELRRILIAAGHRLRVYVPYGRDWYPYSMRRLRENPEVARHVLKAMMSGKPWRESDGGKMMP